jgi:hypothetical protein
MLGFIGNNGQLAFDHRFDGHANRVTLDALRIDIPQRISELHTSILHSVRGIGPADRKRNSSAPAAVTGIRV